MPRNYYEADQEATACGCRVLCTLMYIGIHLVPLVAAVLTFAILFTSDGIHVFSEAQQDFYPVSIDYGLFRYCSYFSFSSGKTSTCTWTTACSAFPAPGRPEPLDFHCDAVSTIRVLAILCSILDPLAIGLMCIGRDQVRVWGGRLVLFVRFLYIVFIFVLAFGIKDSFLREDSNLSVDINATAMAWFWLACLSLLWLPICLYRCWSLDRNPIDAYVLSNND